MVDAEISEMMEASPESLGFGAATDVEQTEQTEAAFSAMDPTENWGWDAPSYGFVDWGGDVFGTDDASNDARTGRADAWGQGETESGPGGGFGGGGMDVESGGRW